MGNDVKYRTHLAASLAKNSPHAVVFEAHSTDSIFAAYNAIMFRARAVADEIEALVLVHEDVEFLECIEDEVRRQFADPRVAILGVIGGRGVRGVHWTHCERTAGYVVDTFYGVTDRGRGVHDVDVLDGLILVLSPWAVQNLAFDEVRFKGFHGYDADICLQAREAGRLVRVAPFGVVHHTKGGFGDVAVHRMTDDCFRRKWGIAFDSRAWRAWRRLRNQQY